MAANDKKMGQIPTGTWPTPQNAKQPFLKYRLGIYVPSPREGLNSGKCCLRFHPQT